MADGGMKKCFEEYCTKPKQMTTKDLTKWFTDAKCLKKGTDAFGSNNIDITFSSKKVKGKNFVEYDGFLNLLDALCDKKSKEPKESKSKDEIRQEICEKLSATSKTAKLEADTKKMQSKDAATARMTDSKGYTGAHKERFDADGKGKGKGGRVDEVKNTGYVGAYKGEETYDSTK